MVRKEPEEQRKPRAIVSERTCRREDWVRVRRGGVGGVRQSRSQQTVVCATAK
jgi:hypothetical protein